jgi:hypothetical protein
MAKLKVSVDIDRKLKGQIIKGMTEAAQDMVWYIKETLKTTDLDEWSNSGPLQESLKKRGLDVYTTPGQLDATWKDMIDNIRLDRRFNKITFSVFDQVAMDKGTLWVGADNGRVIQGGGKRPLPDYGKGFSWKYNPYPERGYWLIYEQGAGAYYGRRDITNAYKKIFGESAYTIIAEPNVDFNTNFINTAKFYMTNRINEQI